MNGIGGANGMSLRGTTAMEHASTPPPHASHLAPDQIYTDAPVGLCAFDTDLRYLSINAWLAALNGIPVEDHLGRTIGEVLPDLASTIEPQLQQVIETGHPVVDETASGSTMAASGDKRHFQHTYQPIMSSDGAITGVNCVVLDITERTRAEEQLREGERKLRQAVEEQERLSRNLHDGILQSLYAIGLGLEICQPLEDSNKGCPHMAQLNAVMQEVRSFIAGIERVIETDNFESAITLMVASLTGVHSTHVDVRLDRDIVKTLPHTQAMELLYIAREALSNSLKHAKASQGVGSLRREGDRVILEMSDDGQGFDPHHLLGRGHGLRNITARARHLGGRLHVQSKPGHGTHIILDIPP